MQSEEYVLLKLGKKKRKGNWEKSSHQKDTRRIYQISL